MKLNIVPARQGIQWVRQGILTFRRQPVALTGLFFMFMAAISLCTIVPVLGSVLALALVPGATLGMMAASQEVDRGQFPMPTILAVAFRAGRQQLRAMLVLGAVYAGGFLLLLGLSALADGGEFARLYLIGGRMDPKLLGDASFIGALWIFTLGYLPLSLMLWHAPALVHWHQVAPVKSLFFSLVACWRNKGAFVFFGMAWMGTLTLGLLAAGLVGGAVGSLLPGRLGGELANGLVMGATLVMLAMFFASLVFSFRDCFVPSEPETPDEPPPAAGPH